MNSTCRSQIMQLMTAGRPGCNDDVVVGLGPYLWQQLAFGNRYGDIEMSFGIPERACHSATTRIQVCDLRTGNALEECFCESEQAHGFLMTMAMQQYSAAGCPKSERVRLRYCSTDKQASATRRAAFCSSPRSRAGASSFTAERQLGSRTEACGHSQPIAAVTPYCAEPDPGLV